MSKVLYPRNYVDTFRRFGISVYHVYVCIKNKVNLKIFKIISDIHVKGLISKKLYRSFSINLRK